MKYNALLTFVLLLIGMPCHACLTCNKQIQEGIWDSTFYPNLLAMCSAFIALAIIVCVLTAVSTARHRKWVAANKSVPSPVPLTTASMVLGMGLGGFMDGIVLHQILQWHEMLSNKIPSTEYIGKSINMFWDGVFHFFCLLVVLTGTWLLWKVVRRKDANTSGRLLAGGLLTGWGLFNIVEGIIDHHILGLHYVMQFSATPQIANLIFIGASVVLLLSGWLIAGSVHSKNKLHA